MSNNDNHNKKHSSNPNDNQENQYQASPMDHGDKIVDMKKFDQSEILKLIQHATEIGKTSNEKLSKPFLDAIPSMKLSGSAMHKDIGNHINDEHKNVLKSFNNVFKSASDYVNDTQNMQSTERPSDFQKDPVNDLRPKVSTGFPLEDKDFHKRIPKIEIEESLADEANKTNEQPKPKIIRGNNPNNAVVGLSPAPKIGSVFDALDNLIQYGKNAISGLISDITKEPAINSKQETKQAEVTKLDAKSKEDIDSVTKYPVKDLSISEKGVAVLARIEGGYRGKPYYDKTGKDTTKWIDGATIGYGHFIKKDEWEKYKNGITKEEAIKLKQTDIQEHVDKMRKYIKEDVKLTQNEFDALAMRAFNCGGDSFAGKHANTNGSAKVVEYINDGKDLKSEEFELYYQKLNTSVGEYMRGVEKRRIIELDILQNNDYTTHPDEYYWKRRKYGHKK